MPASEIARPRDDDAAPAPTLAALPDPIGSEAPTKVETASRRLFAEMVVATAPAAEASAIPDHRAAVPFASVLARLAAPLSTRIQTRCPGLHRLSLRARRALIDDLIARLATIAAPAMVAELAADRELDRLAGDCPTRRYTIFVERRLAPGRAIARFFADHPDLTHALATAATQWIADVARLLARLDGDWDALASLAPEAPPSSHVIAIAPWPTPDAPAPFARVLRLDSGVEILYQPRALDREAALAALLGQLAAAGVPAPRAARLWAGVGYGWIERPAPRACAGPDELRRYHHHAGALLAAVAVTGATCTRDQLIACGDQPIAIALGDGRACDDVLATAMIATWRLRPDGVTVDVGALAIPADTRPSRLIAVWHGLGGDRPRVAPVLAPDATDHAPGSALARLADDDAAAALLAGFDQATRAMSGWDDGRGLATAARALTGQRAQVRVALRPRFRLPPALHRDDAGTLDLIDAALSIGDWLCARGVRDDDHGWSWLGPSAGTARDDAMIRLPTTLYGGTAGIALALAALWRIGGDGRHREAALGGARALVRELTGGAEARRVDAGGAPGIGGIAGTTSILYALAHIARLADAPGLIDVAARGATAISADDLDRDLELDLTGGAAGAALALLALHRAGAPDAVLDRACACGLHLLARRTTLRSGRRAWIRRGAPIPAGLAHGRAGLTLALAGLARATGEPAFAEAARDAVRELGEVAPPSSPEHGQAGSPDADLGWCGGPIGIGLARLGCLDVVDGAIVRADLDAALARALADDHAAFDHVCCGELARAELLAVAGRVLARPELHAAARAKAHRVVARARQAGGFQLDLSPATPAPGFFQGLAGVAYQLLRISHPDLPSVLLLQ